MCGFGMLPGVIRSCFWEATCYYYSKAIVDQQLWVGGHEPFCDRLPAGERGIGVLACCDMQAKRIKQMHNRLILSDLSENTNMVIEPASGALTSAIFEVSLG